MVTVAFGEGWSCELDWSGGLGTMRGYCRDPRGLGKYSIEGNWLEGNALWVVIKGKLIIFYSMWMWRAVDKNLNLEAVRRWYYEQKLEQEARVQGELKSWFEKWNLKLWLAAGFRENGWSWLEVEMWVIHIEVGDYWPEVWNELLSLNLVVKGPVLKGTFTIRIFLCV